MPILERNRNITKPGCNVVEPDIPLKDAERLRLQLVSAMRGCPMPRLLVVRRLVPPEDARSTHAPPASALAPHLLSPPHLRRPRASSLHQPQPQPAPSPPPNRLCPAVPAVPAPGQGTAALIARRQSADPVVGMDTLAGGCTGVDEGARDEGTGEDEWQEARGRRGIEFPEV